MVFIYHLESVADYSSIVSPFLEMLEYGRFYAVTSIVSLLEITVLPLRLKMPEVADEYEALLVNYPNLDILNVDRLITRRAAELRAMNRFQTPDSLQLATAIEAGASIFITNDRALTHVLGIEVIVLDDFR